MTKIQLLEMLTNRAKGYRLNAVDSINRNRHMNDISNLSEMPDQHVVDAILVDFINSVGAAQGVDYGLYTQDLNQ